MKIAVVGAGAAGLSAAWLLSKSHEVVIYEQDTRLGGHAHTVDIPTAEGTIPVDTGFIVYNERNYPNLTALFDHLGVKTIDSDMSFAASLMNGGLEYAGTDLNGLFGQRKNILRLRFWRMLRDLKRFYDQAPHFLNATSRDLSLGEYLTLNGYSDAFVRDHILPMGAAIWSTSAERMAAYPAKAFIRFFVSHGLLTLNNRPQWKTVEGGSRQYVAKIAEAFTGRVRLKSEIKKIERLNDHVIIQDGRRRPEEFDHVVIAGHADQALALLCDANEMERNVLGAFRYTENRAVLHRDVRLMPKRNRVWASWNFIEGDKTTSESGLCVTYWMNKLQSLATNEQWFVTLNPAIEPKTALIEQEFIYHHPLFDQAAMAAQQQLWDLQGAQRTWFCGSYFGYGFHEDAIQSGLKVAEELGGSARPWLVEGANNRLILPRAEKISALGQAA
jgi:predicted NAD/FAD-binding protein